MRDWQAFVRARLSLPDLTPAREARICRELAAQLDDFYRDALARGLPESDAAAFAESQIADWSQIAADIRRADRPHLRPRIDRLADRFAPPAGAPVSRPSTGLLFMHAVQDVRSAIRQLIKAPGFSAIAVLTLALGIGATTAMFSVVNGVLLRSLPYAAPDALVRIHEVLPQYGRFSVAPATFLDWRAQNTVFDRLAVYGTTSATFTDGDTPERVPGAIVSFDLFDLLGIVPAKGTGFTAAQDQPGGARVMVISHGLWERRFGRDPDIVGKSVTVGGNAVTVLGVMPPDFYFPSRTTAFWTPAAIDPASASRGAHYLGVIGRLKSGVTTAQAGGEMKAISERLAEQYPEDSARESAEVVPLLDQVVGGVRPALLMLLGAVGVVVLIACANVANLLLVRATVRKKEVAIRSALGAGRGRLALQMLVESLVLATVGGGLGVLLAYLVITPIQTLGAGSIPRVADVTIDGRVLAFALGTSLLAGILFGLVPAWHASRSRLNRMLKDSSRSSTASGGQWLRNGLLVGEVALSIVLLVGAALLLRSFARVSGLDPGFRPDRVFAFQVSLPQASYPQDGNRIGFFESLLGKLGAVPGVSAAGMVQSLPMRGDYVLTFDIQGRSPTKPGEEPSAHHRVVSPDYFKALGIPLKQGRMFTPGDTESSQMVAIVDEAFAKKHFPNESPIGQGLDIGNGTDGFYQIVGVVGDVHSDALDSPATATMYVPYRQDVFGAMWVVLRTDGDPSALASPVRQTLQGLDRNLPAYSATPLATVLSDSIATRRFSMLLLTAFALLALFLAAVGLYGVVTYTVSQRTREIGLRLAIGAGPADVIRLVVGGGMKLALAGVAIGLVAAVALSRVIQSLLFSVTTSDPLSYAATAGGLLAIAAVACYVPARRATRVDPLVTLQSE